MQNNIKRSSARRHGTAILEAAVALPFLLVFTLVLLQYAMIYHATLGVEHAHRQAMRFASVHGRDLPVGGLTANQRITAAAVTSGRQMGVRLFDSDVQLLGDAPNTTALPNNRAEYEQLTITINYDVLNRVNFLRNPTLPFIGTIPIFRQTYTISGSVVLEGYPTVT